MLIFGLDDLFLNLLALANRIRPTSLDPNELQKIKSARQKKIAVLIANWHEEDVLEAMVRGNTANIRYQNYTIFLGVYPNDEATLVIAKRLERNNVKVRVLLNSCPGPTSKGQLLNEMLRQIMASEKSSLEPFDLFLMHDSEDLIHPESFSLINSETENHDFIQLPVFSLKIPWHQMIAATYMDEFAEVHTRDLLVRSHFKLAVPSAGVGTALTRRLVLSILRLQNGELLDSNCLTEDYQLGHRAHRLGFRSAFICRYIQNNSKRDFIATREYFPDRFKTSLKQKTRWTLGVAFQARAILGWWGGLGERYFLWRDWRAPLNSLLVFGATAWLLSFSVVYFIYGHGLHVGNQFGFLEVCAFNLGQMILRLAIRTRTTFNIYGLSSCLLVPLRWPIANLINTLASAQAAHQYLRYKLFGEQLKWAKTQHRLPAGFGLHSQQQIGGRK